MAKEIAKKLIAELQTNEELKAQVEGITDPEELAKKAIEAGYDVTADELVEAEKEFRKELAEKSDAQAKKLSVDELENVAGGDANGCWEGEIAPDGHEMGCDICYHGYDWSKEHNIWCSQDWYCARVFVCWGNFSPDTQYCEREFMCFRNDRRP